MSFLRLRAKPVEAIAAKCPESTPHTSDANARASKMPPYINILTMPFSPASYMEFMSIAIINGMTHSNATSSTINTGVNIDCTLYCRILPANFFNI